MTKKTKILLAIFAILVLLFIIFYFIKNRNVQTPTIVEPKPVKKEEKQKDSKKLNEDEQLKILEELQKNSGNKKPVSQQKQLDILEQLNKPSETTETKEEQPKPLSKEEQLELLKQLENQ